MHSMKRASTCVCFLAATIGAGVADGADDSTKSWAAFSRARAEALEHRGAYEDAEEEWLALAQILPRDVEPWARAAVLAVDVPARRNKELTAGSQAYRTAQFCLQQAGSRAGRTDSALAYAAGRFAYAEGRWGAAWKYLRNATDWGFDPVRARFWHYRATVNRSLLLVEQGRAQEAVEELRALLAAEPGHADEHRLLVNLATAEWRVQDIPAATKILEDLIAKAPGAADTYLVLGMILADQGDFDGAQRRLREAMLHASASYGDKTYRDALLHLSDVEVKRDHLDEAEAAARQFLAISKDDPDGLFAMGVVQMKRKDLEGAVKNFRRAARMHPDLATLINLKQALAQSGSADTAEIEEIGKRIEEARARHADAMREELGTPALRDAANKPPDANQPPEKANPAPDKK